MRHRIIVSFLLLAALASNSLLPSMCAAHCTPAKASSSAHHHSKPANNPSADMSCHDCTADVNEIHALTCPSSLQMDARAEKSFTLAKQNASSLFITTANLPNASVSPSSCPTLRPPRPTSHSKQVQSSPRFLSASKNSLAFRSHRPVATSSIAASPSRNNSQPPVSQ